MVRSLLLVAIVTACAVSASQAAQLGIRLLRFKMYPAAHRPAHRTATPSAGEGKMREAKVTSPEMDMTRMSTVVSPTRVVAAEVPPLPVAVPAPDAAGASVVTSMLIW
jgi:hypothetical protein